VATSDSVFAAIAAEDKSATGTAPQSLPISWDTLQVAGVQFPGVAQVDADRAYRCDKKAGAGVDGATLTGFGHEPGEVKVKVRVWTNDHFARLPAVLALLMPLPKKGLPSPVDVYHPALKLLGIHSLYFTKIGAPRATGTKQVYEIDLAATEFLQTRSSQNAVNTVKSSVTGVAVAPGTLPGQTPGTTPNFGVPDPSTDAKQLGP
jgi:hypothetical protein